MVVSVCTMGSVLPAVKEGAGVMLVLVGLIKLGTKSEGVAEVEEEAEDEEVVVVLAVLVLMMGAVAAAGDGGVAIPPPPLAGEGSFLMNASSAGNRAKIVLRSMACGELEDDALALADLARDCMYAAMVLAKSNVGDRCCKLGIFDVI